MNSCKQSKDDVICQNLMLKFSNQNGLYYWGCSLYPVCNKRIDIVFNPDKLTDFETKLYRVFDCFVNRNSFLMATYGCIYFNLKDPALLDYILKSEIISNNKSEIEIGNTGAKIFYELYYHLMLLPVDSITTYLKNNFPLNQQFFEKGIKPNIFRDVDYNKNKLNEEAFLQYKDTYLNY